MKAFLYKVSSKVGFVWRKLCCKYRRRAGTVPVRLNESTHEIEFLLVQDLHRTGWIFPGTKIEQHN